jgi:hypothetical protein
MFYKGHLEVSFLLDPDMFAEYSKQFPLSVFNSVVQFYPMVEREKLKTELEVIYSRQDFRYIVGAIKMLSFIVENNLQETYSELIKLLKIIITTPKSTAESERCFSTLKRIKPFLSNSMSDERLNALAMISINKNLIHNINDFDEKVIQDFISAKDRRMDFSFRVKGGEMDR